jgi:hypothetical protein
MAAARRFRAEVALHGHAQTFLFIPLKGRVLTMFANVDLDSVESFAASIAGNWRKFQSFGWHDKPEDADKWAIIYTHNRDSDLLDQSNAAVIAKTIERPKYAKSVSPERHGHWAVGWVDGYAVRIYDKGGRITAVVRKLYDFACALENYPVLDEMDYSMREHEASLDAEDEVKS